MKTVRIKKLCCFFLFILLSLFLSSASFYAKEQTAEDQGYSVCLSGCDYSSIQAAVDDPGFEPGSLLILKDSVFTEADILINKDIILRGMGPQETILQAHEVYGEANTRVLSVAAGTNVVIEGITIRHGNPTECPMYGGGIFNEGNLTLINCIVEDNIGSAGGGIMSRGVLDIRRSIIRRNKTTALGGAGKCGGNGGGLMFTKGNVLIEKSSIYENVSWEGRGGGMYVSCEAVVEIKNSTVSRNSTGGSGGGIFLRGKVSLENVTVAENVATTNGGGVYTRGDLSMKNSILSGNLASGERLASDCVVGDEGLLSGSQRNLISSGECDPLLQGDAGLAEFDENSSLPGYALKEGSQAVDVVLSSECNLDSDQRSLPRLKSENCDLGALEMQPEEKNRQSRTNWFLFVVQFVILGGFLLVMRRVKAI